MEYWSPTWTSNTTQKRVSKVNPLVILRGQIDTFLTEDEKHVQYICPNLKCKPIAFSRKHGTLTYVRKKRKQITQTHPWRPYQSIAPETSGDELSTHTLRPPLHYTLLCQRVRVMSHRHLHAVNTIIFFFFSRRWQQEQMVWNCVKTPRVVVLVVVVGRTRD